MLTPDQKAALARHLCSTNLLTNEELIAELTDHFATAIDEQMATGESFDGALANVQAKFGGWPGLQTIQDEYARGQNWAAWATFRRVALSYVALPRLLITLSLLAGTYWLLVAYWQRAFWALIAINVVIYVVVGWSAWKWEPIRWQHEWTTLSFDGYFKKLAGIQRVVSILFIVALNTPIWLYLFFFPFTYDRPFDGSFAVFASVDITVSYIVFFCIAELTYRDNSLLKRFA